MKNKVITIIAIILLINCNLYAAGDLIVNGNLGVGVSTPTMKLHVEQGNPNYTAPVTLMGGGILLGNETTEKTVAAGYYFSQFDNTVALSSSRQIAINAYSQWVGRTDFTKNFAIVGGMYTAEAQPNAYNLNVSDLLGIWARTAAYDFSGSANVTNAYNIYAGGHVQSTAGKTTANAYNFYGEAHTASSGTITNAYGIFLEQQTSGTNNYGIVLSGDGDGSDIVFGPNQEARIYSSGGELFVQDGASNVTQISPHDPVTGEWIFYSKNIKTGRVVRINMEKLVKAVEKLTGEKFMVEFMASE